MRWNTCRDIGCAAISVGCSRGMKDWKRTWKLHYSVLGNENGILLTQGSAGSYIVVQRGRATDFAALGPFLEALARGS